MRRQFPLFIAVIALACASGQTAGGAAGAGPTERQKIVNLVPFDVANCFPSTLDVGKTANEYTLQAAFRGARPQIGECLVDGRNQAPAGTKGKATITLDGSGTTVTVTADGLQPAASSCIEKAIRSQLEGQPAMVYRAGESFFEPPGAIHLLAENMSATEPARILAVFVADEGATLTTYH